MAAPSKPFPPIQYTLVHMLAGLMLLAGGCSQPVVHYNPSPIGALPAGSLSLGWIADLPMEKDAITRIDVEGDTLYVFSRSKHVTALNRKAGSIKFISQIKSPSPKLHPPVELADQLIFPTVVSLEIFDKSGQFIRSVPLSAPLRGGACGAENTIYFGADDPGGGRILAVDINRNFATTRWELLTPGGAITSTPIFYNSTLFVGNEAGSLYAVNELRNPVWNIPNGVFQTGGPIVADIKADVPDTKAENLGVYVASKDTRLYCINVTTGKLKWVFFAGSPLDDAPTPTTDVIYQPIPGRGIACIDRNSTQFNRSARWIYPSATQFLAQDDKYAYLAEPRMIENGRHFFRKGKVQINVIVAIDKVTGVKAFESKHSDFSVFATNPIDSTIYVGYAGGEVLALKPTIKAGQIGELVLTPMMPEMIAAR